MLMGNGVSFYTTPYGSAPFVGLLANCNQGLTTSTQQPLQGSYYNSPYQQQQQQQLPSHQLTNNEQDNASLFKLYDFNTNNQSEIIRFIFYFAGISFKDKRVKQEEWDRVKDNIPIQQLPILRVNNHFKIYYLNNIIRYLAREFCLYGTGNQDFAIVDMIFEINSVFQEKFFEQMHSTTNIEERKMILSQFIVNHAIKYLNQLEKFYKIFNRNGPFYLGTQISLADLVVYQTNNYLIDIDPKILDNYSHLKEAYNHLEKHPQIIHYLNNRKYSKIKKKRNVTLSPTSHNMYHSYQRYQSYDGRKSSRHRHRHNITPISKQAHQKIDCTTTIKNINDIIPPSQNDVIDSIVILDQHTHEARVSVRLLNREEALSVCVITFADDLSSSYIAVGTAIIFEDEDTPKVGRVILYRYKSGHLNMVTEKELNGAPHAMLAFQGKLLIAVGSSIRLYKFSPQNHELIQLTQYLGHIDCLQVKIKDDFVLFNDLMKSITVLRYNTDEGKFEED
ncbi:unnamed protein product [Adineta steineri]|uniref:Uncharacterized protein n=1 Tax=Adineta steineri TaxID=433720 RepID=A0A814YHQ7_9BILA|nr:unnamed protein product [Adineta steineri]